MNKNRSIAESVRLWMIAVAIAPLIIMALQGYHCAREAVLELKHEQLQVVAQAKEQRILDWIQERSRELTMLSRFVALDLHETPSTNCPIIEAAIESSILLNDSAYESIELYSRDWKPVWGRRSELHDESLLLPPSFREELEKSEGAVISKPHIHENGMIGIHIGVPLDVKHDSLAQYIIAVLELSSTVYPALAPETSKATAVQSCIVSETGLLLTGVPDGVRSDKRVVKLPDALVKADGKPAVYHNFDQQKVVGVATHIDELGWILITEAKTHHAFMWLHHLKVRAVITGIIALALVLVLAAKSARRISNPLRHMAEVAQSVSLGQFDARMQYFPGREHVLVADAFNQMMDEIERAKETLAHAAALSAIGKLSASIVHEMRNPLSAVMMNLSVIKGAVQEDPVHAELAEIASDQALRLEVMLNDLLLFGKKIELDKVAVTVDEFCKEVSACIRTEEVENVSFEISNQHMKPLFVDKEQMLRAVTNLVDNALQASPANGTVILTVRESDAAETLFEVRDQGEGISERVGEKLFEPFFTMKKRGTGLGLPNVKKIVELHGGDISFVSSQEGSVFTIRLPLGGSTDE
ncbi:ATP-binding protein [Pontiellaceae bacterium B12219]|nr:ATP-binding protein [Pontiellaceae bacterium B12219]